MILCIVFVVGVGLLWVCLPQGIFRNFISGRPLFYLSVSAVTLMTAVEGTLGTELHSSVPFLVAAVLLMVSLEFIILDTFRRKRSMASLLCHLGMFLVSTGAFWGAHDVIDADMVVIKGETTNMASSTGGRPVPLPFELGLKEFRIDCYEDGTSPRQYTSILDADGQELVTSVNHPCLYKGYRIYQSDYDRYSGSYSVLKIVRDPWRPLIYIGMLVLAIGAVLSMKVGWNSRYLPLCIAVLAVAFSIFSLARINFGTLMPVLRSLWFVPHVALYMLAYASLATASVTGLLSLSHRERPGLRSLSIKLLSTASSLLLLGMICGAVWAGEAWGDWWSWDAKECWAAVTWLFTLSATHIGNNSRREWIARVLLVLVAFLAMQIAWYGVEWLPASMDSMHAYRI